MFYYILTLIVMFYKRYKKIPNLFFVNVQYIILKNLKINKKFLIYIYNIKNFKNKLGAKRGWPLPSHRSFAFVLLDNKLFRSILIIERDIFYGVSK